MVTLLASVNINNTALGEFLVLVIGLGSVVTMIVKVSNYQNDLKRDFDKSMDKVNNKLDKLNFKINTLAITAKTKQDLNSSRITTVEKFLEKNAGYSIRVDLPTTHSGADFLESLENLDRE